MLIKNLLKLFGSFGRSVNTSQRIFSYHISHFGKTENESKHFKHDIISNKDNLLEELRVLSPTKILILLEKHSKKINGSHIVVALNSIVKVQKKDLFGANKKDMLHWKRSLLYEQFSELIISHIDKLTGSQCIRLLDLLSRMKIPPPTELRVTQSILRKLHHFFNDLSLSDYSVLSVILNKMPKTNLITEIRNSLKQTFVMKVSMGFEDNNITHLEQSLSFVSHNMTDSRLLEFFLNKFQKYNDDIPYKNAIIILESLCSMRRYPLGWLNVLHKVQNSIAEYIEVLNEDEIKYIILLISKVLKTYNKEEFYNAVFINKLIQKLIVNDVGLETALSVLKSIKNIRHLNKELINYACASYFERIALVGGKISDHTGKLLVLISSLAAANHKTLFWKDIEDNIMNNDSWLNYDHKTLCILALNLACLNCYPKHILKKVFNGEYDYSREAFLHWTFCKIYQNIKCIPNYEGPFPDESVLNSLEKLHQKTCKSKTRSAYPLLSYLEEGMGGPVYVKINISTKLFHMIDYVVAFQEDGNPIPINGTTNIDGSFKMEYIENLKLPPKSRIVLLLLLPHFWYFRNTNELVGIFKTTVDTLGILHSVVPIHEGVWESISDKEKKSYLMNKIHSKIYNS